MLTGNEFQTLGVENRKARDPKYRYDDIINVVVVTQGRRLRPGARNNASSFRRSDEVCSSVGDGQRHPQVRDVCPDAAAEPRNWIQL